MGLPVPRCRKGGQALALPTQCYTGKRNGAVGAIGALQVVPWCKCQCKRLLSAGQSQFATYQICLEHVRRRQAEEVIED
jgi:hypothetical protein